MIHTLGPSLGKILYENRLIVQLFDSICANASRMLILELEQVVCQVGVRDLIRPLRRFSARARYRRAWYGCTISYRGAGFSCATFFLLLVSLGNVYLSEGTAPPVH